MILRVRYTKLGKVRFLGHRDLARCWERAIRRTNLRLAYSQGFSPRPKVHFGLALPTGAESVDEYIDLDVVDDAVEPAETAARLSAALPVGMECLDAAVVEAGVSLQEQVDVCLWCFAADGVARPTLQQRSAAVLAAERLPIEVDRKGKRREVDLRPQIRSIRLGDVAELSQHSSTLAQNWAATDDSGLLFVELSTKPRGVRPEEFLTVMELADEHFRVARLNQWTNVDGKPAAPIPDRGGDDRTEGAVSARSPEMTVAE